MAKAYTELEPIHEISIVKVADYLEEVIDDSNAEGGIIRIKSSAIPEIAGLISQEVIEELERRYLQPWLGWNKLYKMDGTKEDFVIILSAL